jgi:hypothetical protein
LKYRLKVPFRGFRGELDLAKLADSKKESDEGIEIRIKKKPKIKLST